MVIGVAGPKKMHKKIKGSIRQQYTYYTKPEKVIVLIIHISEARAILLLFFYHQDIKSK